jgi:hypothetical protein
MRKVLLAAVLAAGLASASSAVAMPRTHEPPHALVAQHAACFGVRRDYRNFNQCWRINARARGAARYCNRICG